MKDLILKIANNVAKENFMHFSDYDEGNPIRDIPVAISVIIENEIVNQQIDEDADGLYDFILSLFEK